jgi:hypothetical protein
LVDYIQGHPDVFGGGVALIFVFNLVTFYVGGRRAERRFSTPERPQIRFRERGASGYSNKSLFTRLGGANRVLEVVVTDVDVWIKGIWPPFAERDGRRISRRAETQRARRVHDGARRLKWTTFP